VNRARATALLLSALVAVYLVTLGWRGVVLLRSGDGPVAVLFGIALLLLPAVGAWAVVRELRFGQATERLAREAEAAGRLPTTDDAFDDLRAAVDASPDDPVAWFRLACGYDAARDRRRARAAMRHAVTLHAPRP